MVERAVTLARNEGFAYSCRPEHGRLLFALAAGAEVIGETGTGCGVGLAWLASGARPEAQVGQRRTGRRASGPGGGAVLGLPAGDGLARAIGR